LAEGALMLLLDWIFPWWLGVLRSTNYRLHAIRNDKMRERVREELRLRGIELG
jgi:hypothetical protein